MKFDFDVKDIHKNNARFCAETSLLTSWFYHEC